MVAIALVGWCILSLTNFAMAGKTYNVIDYQAVGDGVTDDTQAFLKAWGAACKDERSPSLLVPSGKNFLIKKTLLEGPCKSNIIHIKVDGNITAPNYIWTTEMTNLITFHAISNLVFHGTGTIDGRGKIWWDCYNKARCTRPYLLEFVGCPNLVLRHITLKDSPDKHLAFSSCTNLIVHGVKITAPGNSPNTDGIVMQDCQNVQITGCIIGTGDDCIAVLTNTSNVNISRIRCGPGHGISIGSLGKDNTNAAVERIHIHDSTIYNALTGARIKTWQGGSGYARNITFERISMANVTTPIVIDQTYNTLQVSTDVAISNIVFRNIHGTSTQEVAIKLDCSAIVPCKELIFDEITLTRIGVNQTVFAASQNAYGMTNGTIIPSLHLG